MQAIQWTDEIVILGVVLALVVGLIAYLLAALFYSKKNAVLNSQLQVTKTDLANKVTQCDTLASDNASQGQRYHDLELSYGKLEEKLQAYSDKLEEQGLQYRSRLEELTRELNSARSELVQQKNETLVQSKTSRAAEVKAEEVEAKYQEAKQRVVSLEHKQEALQEKYNTLSTEHTELITTLDQREKHFKEQLTQFTESKQLLTKEFENIANKIFEQKGKTFTDTSKASIDVLLKPFREQIEGFQKRINDVHDASIKGNADLGAEIKKVLDVGLKMSQEATNLTTALKGESQQRGAWGEAQLMRTLEMSGLVDGDHYEKQSAFKDAEGKQKQTDYLVKLPDNKHIIIDSKVSLIAYDRAVSAEGAEEQEAAMAEHVKAVKRHIDDLASKDYTNLVGVHSPSFVLMFMPIEPAYIEALKSNKNLFSYGYNKGVVLVSHTTLIPILRTVANLWIMERSNAEAREISDRAGEIFNQVCIIAERLQKLGGTLKTVSNHYNSTVTALSGQQGLHGKVERFTQLSNKVSKNMPEIEPAHMDFDIDKLSLIVEPVDEPETETVLTLVESETKSPEEQRDSSAS